jgi:hypothetical protein
MQSGQQFINLDKNIECTNKKGVVMHEILHTLGFHHMHTHTSRDQYIKLYPRNIKNFNTNQNYFLNDASRVSSFNTPYDFFSIMHYPPFNSDGQRVIKPHENHIKFYKFMGQRVALSDGDVERVNNMYQCKTAESSVFNRPRSRPPLMPVPWNGWMQQRHRPPPPPPNPWMRHRRF